MKKILLASLIIFGAMPAFSQDDGVIAEEMPAFSEQTADLTSDGSEVMPLGSEIEPLGYYYMRCQSISHLPQRCYYNARSVYRVQLVEQNSRSACVLGSTWGATQTHVWVSNGCRGLFKVSY